MNKSVKQLEKKFHSVAHHNSVQLEKVLLDGRGRIANERMVLKQIKQYGGASIFWVTVYPKRAAAVQRLQDRGDIIRHRRCKRDAYPWCVFTIKG